MLNRSVIYAFVACIIGLVVSAQTQQSRLDSLHSKYANKVKTLLSVGVGASIPVSDFGLKDANNNASGFADLGYNINVSLAWIIKRGWGVALMYRYQSNDIDKQSLMSQYSSKYPNIKWDISSTPWGVNAFLLGSCNSFPIGGEDKGTFFDTKVMLGLVRSKSFGMTVIGTQGSNSATVNSPATSGTAFGYCLGLGIKREIARDVYIGFYADFFQSSINYGNVVTTATGGYTTTSAASQKISTVNLFASLIIRID